MKPEWMSQDFELFDTHAHLGDDGCPDETEYYRRAEEAGVPWILLCGSDFESSRRAAEFASHFDRVFFQISAHRAFPVPLRYSALIAIRVILWYEPYHNKHTITICRLSSILIDYLPVS